MNCSIVMYDNNNIMIAGREFAVAAYSAYITTERT